MSFTLRPRFVIVAFFVAVLVTAIAALSGAGIFALLGVPVALVYGCLCRRSLRVDERGVRYRCVWPPNDFRMSWEGITEVILDVVRGGSPGTASSPKLRIRFGRVDGAPRTATLPSTRGAQSLLDACRARHVPIVDERGRPRG
jgi:hypothetical protein